MIKPLPTCKKPRKQYTPEFRTEDLKLAERIGVPAVNSSCMNRSCIPGAANNSR